MGTSVSNQTQKNYKPPADEEVVQTQLNERPPSNEPRQSNQSNARPVEAGQERKVAQSALPPRQPNKMTNSVLMEPQSNNRGSKQQSQSHLRPPSSSFRAGSAASSAVNSSDRVVQLNQSKIYVHTEKFNDKNMEISAIKVKGFQGEGYQGKKLNKFNVSIDVVERQMIKESNYFDESNDDIGIYSLVSPKYGDFNINQFNQLETFPVNTYLFDVPLKERMTQ